VNDISKFIEQLQAEWQDEQHRRYQLWKDITDDVKTELIDRQIIYHSLAKWHHSEIGLNLLEQIRPYVRKNHLGTIGFEKWMISTDSK